jgi:hypothetical protein
MTKHACTQKRATAEGFEEGLVLPCGIAVFFP